SHLPPAPAVPSDSPLASPQHRADRVHRARDASDRVCNLSVGHVTSSVRSARSRDRRDCQPALPELRRAARPLGHRFSFLPAVAPPAPLSPRSSRLFSRQLWPDPRPLGPPVRDVSSGRSALRGRRVRRPRRAARRGLVPTPAPGRLPPACSRKCMKPVYISPHL